MMNSENIKEKNCFIWNICLLYKEKEIFMMKICVYILNVCIIDNKENNNITISEICSFLLFFLQC